MPSQIFDDGYGIYEVPSGERLVFKGGEGADASYNIPSSFDIASSPQRGRTWGLSDRFTSPGSYLKHESVPGPGAYSFSGPAKPVSRCGTLGPENGGSQDRLKFDGVGEGADAVYSSKSAFERAASPSRTANGFGASQRFGKVNSYVSGSYSDAPGPGTYTQAPGVMGDIYAAPKSSPAPPRNTERLNFNAMATSGMGESPGPVYKVGCRLHASGSSGCLLRALSCRSVDTYLCAGLGLPLICRHARQGLTDCGTVGRWIRPSTRLRTGSCGVRPPGSANPTASMPRARISGRSRPLARGLIRRPRQARLRGPRLPREASGSGQSTSGLLVRVPTRATTSSQPSTRLQLAVGSRPPPSAR